MGTLEIIAKDPEIGGMDVSPNCPSVTKPVIESKEFIAIPLML